MNTIVPLPYRPRRPSLARPEPASVLKHPKVGREFSPEFRTEQRLAEEREDERRMADLAMVGLVQNINLLLLKAETLAKMHDRHEQVQIMFDEAAEKIHGLLKRK